MIGVTTSAKTVPTGIALAFKAMAFPVSPAGNQRVTRE